MNLARLRAVYADVPRRNRRHCATNSVLSRRADQEPSPQERRLRRICFGRAATVVFGSDVAQYDE